MSDNKQNKTQKPSLKWNRDEGFMFYCIPNPDGTPRSYADVAKMFGVSESAIQRYATRSKWLKRREDAGKKRVQRFLKKQERIAEKTNFAQFENLNLLERGVMNAIKMLLSMQTEIVNDSTLDVEQKIKLMKGLKMQSLDLKNLSDALKTAQNQKRIILGLPIDITKAEVKQTNRNVTLSSEDIAEMDEFMRKNNVNDSRTS